MWWLTAKKWFKISSAWCRQHWRWVVMASVALLMYYFGKKASRVQLIQAKLALRSYEKEKEAIESAHQKEVEGIKKAQKTYNTALAQVDQQFSSKTDSLSLEKEKRVRKMINKAKKDPDEINKILEQEMGIKRS